MWKIYNIQEKRGLRSVQWFKDITNSKINTEIKVLLPSGHYTRLGLVSPIGVRMQSQDGSSFK